MTLTNGMLTAAGVSPAVTNIAGLNTVTTATLTDDASSGISSAKTYTHALDFGDQPAATVNGVAFAQVTAASGTLSGTPYGWSGFPTDKHNNFGDWTNTVPVSAVGLRALLRDMLYAGRATTVKLTGLVPGTAYESASLYPQLGWPHQHNRAHRALRLPSLQTPHPPRDSPSTRTTTSRPSSFSATSRPRRNSPSRPRP